MRIRLNYEQGFMHDQLKTITKFGNLYLDNPTLCGYQCYSIRPSVQGNTHNNCTQTNEQSHTAYGPTEVLYIISDAVADSNFHIMYSKMCFEFGWYEYVHPQQIIKVRIVLFCSDRIQNMTKLNRIRIKTKLGRIRIKRKLCWIRIKKKLGRI